VHSHFHDTYSHLESPVHRLPAWVKVVAALTLVVLLVTLKASPILFWHRGIRAGDGHCRQQHPRDIRLKRLIFLEPFVLGVAVLTLFQPMGE